MSDKPEGERIETRVTDLIIRLSLLGLFIYLSFALIRPLLPILVWAVVLAVALAPVQDWLSARLGGRRIAALLLGLLMLVVVIGPVAALSTSLVETVHILIDRIQSGALHLPPPPPRLADLPMVGPSFETAWQLASTNLEGLVLRHREALAPIGARVVGLVSQIGLDLIRFILSILLAAVLLVPAPGLAAWGRRLARRVLAPRGEKFVELSTQTIRNVSRGVVGIAIVQTILISVVLQVAGVAGAGLLAFVILVLCILQIGPAPVVLPVLVWAWLTMSAAHALLLTAILVPLTVMDNVLKPLLMGRGLSTPTVVIFMGLIGGTLSFGLIGLFLGPVVLAVFYDLLRSWIHDPAQTDPAEGN